MRSPGIVQVFLAPGLADLKQKPVDKMHRLFPAGRLYPPLAERVHPGELHSCQLASFPRTNITVAIMQWMVRCVVGRSYKVRWDEQVAAAHADRPKGGFRDEAIAIVLLLTAGVKHRCESADHRIRGYGPAAIRKVKVWHMRAPWALRMGSAGERGAVSAMVGWPTYARRFGLYRECKNRRQLLAAACGPGS